MLNLINLLRNKLFSPTFVSTKTITMQHLELINRRELTAMYNRDEISKKCLDTIFDRYWAYKDGELAIIDLGQFIAVEVFDTGVVMHFNKYAI